jgi:predicted nucleic acid-binding protein
MYLLDTNIILELLLDQESADEVERFLRDTPPEQLHLSEFTLYSLGVILFRRGEHATFWQVIEDLLVMGGMRLVRLEMDELRDIVQVATSFNLDFDDAYQYATAERYHLIVVSFDGDFDRTERGRRTPGEILRRPTG